VWIVFLIIVLFLSALILIARAGDGGASYGGEGAARMVYVPPLIIEMANQPNEIVLGPDVA
jgi:hypothetical protein